MSDTPRLNELRKQAKEAGPSLAAKQALINGLEEELAAAQQREERLRGLLDDFRDTVLHQRGALAENGMTNDQVNDVLGEFDDRFSELNAAPTADAAPTYQEILDKAWGGEKRDKKDAAPECDCTFLDAKLCSNSRGYDGECSCVCHRKDAAPTVAVPVCDWDTEDGEWFSTGCGKEFMLIEGSDVGDMKFCCYCGRTLAAARGGRNESGRTGESDS